MRNVHEFDGKIPMKLDFLYEENQIQQIVNDAEFLTRMQNDARIMINKVLLENTEKNLDFLNNHIDARQLFVALLSKISKISNEEDKQFYSSLLEEQLCDMKNLGPCPQGRTIRLWQLYQTLE